MPNNSDSYMAKVENVLSEWEAHGIDASQARKRFREIVQEWLASPPGPESEAVKLLRRCHDAGDLVTPLDETLREDVAAFFGGKDG
jgi:hypothetical protein